MRETKGSNILVCTGVIRPIELNRDKKDKEDRIDVGDYASKESTKIEFPTVDVSDKPYFIFRDQKGNWYRQVGDEVIKIECETIIRRFAQRGLEEEKEEER